jgi:hypothetical protein
LCTFEKRSILARGGFTGSDSGAFKSGNDGNSRGKFDTDVNVIELFVLFLLEACFNCNKTGHMSRECDEPRKDTRSNRGGFNSGGGDRNSGFRPSANSENTFGSSRNQNSNEQGDSGDSKPTFTGWRGNAGAGTNNNNDSDESSKRTTFNSSTTRTGFTSNAGGSGGFRGKEILFVRKLNIIFFLIGGRGGGGGFSSGDRGKCSVF